MTEHQIRLRKAWEILHINEPAAGWKRFELPARLDPAGGAFRLRRGFRPPRIDPVRERLRLSFRRVAGLRRVELAGRLLGAGDLARDALDLGLPGDLTARVMLELEIDPAGLDDASLGDWGHVAVVVENLGEPDGGRASPVVPADPDSL